MDIRPKQVKDVAHQDEVVRVITNTLETSNCPHMLFYGPPGTGKMTTALAIAHQLFGHFKFAGVLLPHETIQKHNK
ncbi:hypothetical protein KY289_031025 [Solanum tuberosum]|nr:hypothetical protein KY284_031776 [Solanum tuberosum]KAH0653347.1 hypothetical protein KY289_031025 [Solanum tuberosum]